MTKELPENRSRADLGYARNQALYGGQASDRRGLSLGGGTIRQGPELTSTSLSSATLGAGSAGSGILRQASGTGISKESAGEELVSGRADGDVANGGLDQLLEAVYVLACPGGEVGPALGG